MAKEFHEREFDDATQAKLAIFGGYIRNWIPVFLEHRQDGQHVDMVNVFDFFAGPGVDAAGNRGSPRIVQDELIQFCNTPTCEKAASVRVHLYFNDKEEPKIEKLRSCLTNNACPKECCEIDFSALPFQDALAQFLPIMRLPRSANLVIMDQYGLKEVTPEIVNLLAGCPKTDILFFVSSGFVRRFIDEPAIQKYFPLSPEQLAASGYKSIHRHICDFFRANLKEGLEYYLAPFSIKKGSNIYGVVFGSRHHLGFRKFLEVAWKEDEATGEANYNIDDDPAWGGETFLFSEMNQMKKRDAFQKELRLALQGDIGVSMESSLLTNRELYRFTLERGFLPKHANEELRRLQKLGRLEVTDAITGQPVRKGSFYLGDSKARVIFRLKD